MHMKYFTIDTIRESIRHLGDYSGNWLIPAFVFGANDVGEGASVSLGSRHGTDAFLDRFFHGSLIGLPPAPNGRTSCVPGSVMSNPGSRMTSSKVTSWSDRERRHGPMCTRLVDTAT